MSDFFLDDSVAYYPQFIHCDFCIHRFPGKDTCTAFPKGIPKEIILLEETHEKVRPDQVGEFVFEEKK